MRLLLDTQIMLWWLLDDARLGSDICGRMASSDCIVSVASIWEVAIKYRLGKLPVAPATFRDHSLAAGATILPLLHPDPLDRLLIAQARVEGLMAVSSDAHWSGYDVSLVRV